MKLSNLIPAAKFAESAFAAAGLDLEASLEAKNTDVIKAAIGDAMLTEQKLAHFESIEASFVALQDKHASLEGAHAASVAKIGELLADSEARQVSLDELEKAVTAMRAEHDTIKAEASQVAATFAALKLPAAAITDSALLAKSLTSRSSREAAELLAKLGTDTVPAHVPAAPAGAKAHGKSDAQIFEHYKTLSGQERADYYAANTDAIWRGKAAE